MEQEIPLSAFYVWFVEPIEKLKELPNGAGGIVAFMVGLALYERLIVAKLRINDQPTDEESIKKTMSEDLLLSDSQRRIFWDMLRNGFLHQAMPKTGTTICMFHDSFTEYPIFKTIDGMPVICINPWKFTDRVISVFLENPNLINSSESYPFVQISPIPFEKLK